VVADAVVVVEVVVLSSQFTVHSSQLFSYSVLSSEFHDCRLRSTPLRICFLGHILLSPGYNTEMKNATLLHSGTSGIL
jgi:hypothetical protein